MDKMKSASDFMRRKLITLAEDTNVFDGVAKLLRENISGAPVVDADGQFMGVFSEKCSMNALTDAVEVASEFGFHLASAREFMTSKLVTLTPDLDVFDAIDHLLSKRISGAPVVDKSGKYLGIFSEKTAMRVLVAAVHDQFPGAAVESFMNLDRNRIIDKDDSLLDVAHKFQQTPYRRLPVLQGDQLAGQVSRRDVLRAEHRLSMGAIEKAAKEGADSRLCEAVQPKPVGEFMDQSALTTTSNADMLSIAQMFLNSPYRRLPVLENGKLVGQVSRRDLLEVAAEILRPKPEKHRAEALYLSPLSEAPPSLR